MNLLFIKDIDILELLHDIILNSTINRIYFVETKLIDIEDIHEYLKIKIENIGPKKFSIRIHGIPKSIEKDIVNISEELGIKLDSSTYSHLLSVVEVQSGIYIGIREVEEDIRP